MRTNVASIEVDVPVDAAYDRWTRHPRFSAFMDDVDNATQLGDRHSRWMTRFAGVQREFESTVGEHLRGQKIAWTTLRGWPHEAAVTFEPVGADRTVITVSIDHQPNSIMERVADRLGLIRRRLQASLEEFKQNVEAHSTGVDLNGNHEPIG